MFAAAMVVVVSVWLVDVSVVSSVVGRLKTLAEQTKSAARVLTFNYGMLALKPGVTEQYNNVKGSLELPLTDEEIVAETENRDLSPLIQAKGLVVESMKTLPSSLPPVGSAREYVIELSGLEGDTVKLLEFMDDLNQLPGLYRVAQLHLVPGDLPQKVKGSMAVARLVLRSQAEGSEAAPTTP